MTLASILLDTPLGPMLAVADEQTLCLLQFTRSHGFGRHSTLSSYAPAKGNSVLASIKLELNEYFLGNLLEFKTPLKLCGTAFQKAAWEELLRTTYGQTCSYAEQAFLIGKPSSHRAVANANSANKLVIVVPCHRIVRRNGDLGGYGGGIERKKWLVAHEAGVFRARSKY